MGNKEVDVRTRWLARLSIVVVVGVAAFFVAAPVHKALSSPRPCDDNPRPREAAEAACAAPTPSLAVMVASGVAGVLIAGVLTRRVTNPQP